MTQRDSNLKPFDFGTPDDETGPRPGYGRGRVRLVLLILILLAGSGAAYVWYFDRELAAEWTDKAPLPASLTVTTAYKWRDSKGNWQITDEPPPEGVPFETIEVRSDVNILPSVSGTESKN